MKQKINFLLILIMSTLIIYAIAGLTKQESKVIGWIPYWDQKLATQSFKQNANKIDYISLFWYRLDENGNLELYNNVVEDKSIIDFAKKKNVKVLALVANLSDDGSSIWDYKRVDKVIFTKESRKKHIDELIKLVEKNNFDGIDIDYEALKSSQRENFSLFIEDLSKELHKKNKILGVAIHPKTSDGNPHEANGSQAQDLKKIGRHADQLYFMTYLEHGAFSDPGPIGSLPWMRQVLEFGMSQVPKQKVYLGIGLMGAHWIKENDEFKGQDNELPFLEIVKVANQHNITPIWDDVSKTPYLKFQTDSKDNIVWFENAESIKLRVDLAKDRGIGGVAFWRLGGEDERIWRLFN